MEEGSRINYEQRDQIRRLNSIVSILRAKVLFPRAGDDYANQAISAFNRTSRYELKEATLLKWEKKIESKRQEITASTATRQTRLNPYTVNRKNQTKTTTNERIVFTNILPKVFFDKDENIDLRDTLQNYLKGRVLTLQAKIREFTLSIKISIVGERRLKSGAKETINIDKKVPLTEEGSTGIMIINRSSKDNFNFSLSYENLARDLKTESDITIVKASIEEIEVIVLPEFTRNVYLRNLVGFNPSARTLRRSSSEKHISMHYKASRQLVQEGSLCIFESFLTEFKPNLLMKNKTALQLRKQSINALSKFLPAELQQNLKDGKVIESFLNLLTHYKEEDKMVCIALMEHQQIHGILYIGHQIDNEGDKYYCIPLIDYQKPSLPEIDEAIQWKKVAYFFHFQKHIEPITKQDFERDVKRQIWKLEGKQTKTNLVILEPHDKN